MRNLLESFLGKEIDVNCGAALLSGKVTRVEGQILHLEKDGMTVYVNIEKIVALMETREKKSSTPPGFVLKTG
ncbi:MAG TPA: MM0924 family protein [Blastocatellia bacterium]|nr:MM0924 family protein [Blastocatellia bacterium]